MGKSSSNDELTIRNQFDRICKLALKGEAADYYRHIAYRQKHEVLFSELSQKELDSIFGVDKYPFLFFAVSEQVYLDNFIFFLQDAENSGAV